MPASPMLPPPSTPAPPGAAAWRDGLALALVLAAFWAVSLGTLNRLPYPWIDEVLLAEPGINLATGHGFTSAAWQTSRSDAVFASPYPLHSLFLGGWVAVFGVSQTSVRLATLFQTAAGVVLIWAAVRRLNLVRSIGARTWLAALIFCDYGYAFAYRGGRPEAMAVLLCAVMFFGFTWRPGPARDAVLFVGATLVAFSGLQVVAFCLLLGFALCLFWRGRWGRETALVAAGLAVGTLGFVALYHRLGIWPAFQQELAFQGSTNLLERVRERLTTNPIRNHSITIPKDLSLALLAVAVGVTTVALARRRALGRDSLGRLGVLVAVIVPAGLYFGLRFSTYYSWMAAVPLAVIYNALWSRPDFPAGARRAALALQGAACLAGLPLQLALAACDWRDRDPAPVARFVNAAVRPEDVVYCDWTAYYPAKLRARQVYLPKYLLRIEPAEAASVTVAIVSPHATPRLELDPAGQLAALGGRWVPTGERFVPSRPGILGNDWRYGYLSLPNYTLEVYRRASETPDPPR